MKNRTISQLELLGEKRAIAEMLRRFTSTLPHIFGAAGVSIFATTPEVGPDAVEKDGLVPTTFSTHTSIAWGLVVQSQELPTQQDIVLAHLRSVVATAQRQLEEYEKRFAEAATIRCDGDHAAPACADPECWRRGEEVPS